MQFRLIGLVLLAVLPLVGCSFNRGVATVEDVEYFEQQCNSFLAGRVSGERFEASARPPWLVEAHRRGCRKVDGSLQVSGRITLQGVKDHSGTEVAVLVAYGQNYMPYMVVSPLVVTTKSDGSFDLLSRSITALNVKLRALRAGREGVLVKDDGEEIGYSYLETRVTDPRLNLLIRHAGYSPRMVGLTLVSNDEEILRGEQKFVFNALELLPERQTVECRKAFVLRTNELKPSWTSLMVSRGNPGTMRRPGKLTLHLREHPDCSLADDALFRFLSYHYEMERMFEPSAPDREELFAGMELFRSRFLDAKDNTGILMEQSVGGDGTWRVAFERMEARFFSKVYYKNATAQELANAVRATPHHISFVPLYYFVPDFRHPDRQAMEWEYLPDADVTSLVYRAIVDARNWRYAMMAIQKAKDRRAVPILCRILEWREGDDLLRLPDGSLAVNAAGRTIPDPLVASIASAGGLLQVITGLRLEGADVWLAWWKTSGSKRTWPSLPRDDFPEGWLDDLLASRYPKVVR